MNVTSLTDKELKKLQKKVNNEVLERENQTKKVSFTVIVGRKPDRNLLLFTDEVIHSLAHSINENFSELNSDEISQYPNKYTNEAIGELISNGYDLAPKLDFHRLAALVSDYGLSNVTISAYYDFFLDETEVSDIVYVVTGDQKPSRLTSR